MSNSLSQLPPLKANLPTLTNKKEVIEESDEENYQTSEESEQEMVESRKIDNNSSFFATFTDGSSFRYLIEYLRLTSLDGTFVFTKDHIIYQREDEDKSIFNDVKIRTYDLTEYEFSSSNNEITSTLNLSELRNKTRTVGKKEQMDIYKLANEPSNFYIQVRSQEKGTDNPVFYCMPTKSEDVNLYELPEFGRGKNNPNCTIYQSDFSKLCKALVANKCSTAEFIGFNKGLIIKGYSSEKKVVMVKEYGKTKTSQPKMSNTKSINESNVIKPRVAPPKLNIKDADEIERFTINIANIKALSKLNGFSPNSTIKFYIQPKTPMMIVAPIGSYGELKVLLRS